MTTFSNSHRLLKGGIVLIDPTISSVQRIIALHYNSDTISFNLQGECMGKDSIDRSESLRIKEPPLDALKFETEINGIDQRHLLQTCIRTAQSQLFSNSGIASNPVENIAVSRMSTGCIQLTCNNLKVDQQNAQSV